MEREKKWTEKGVTNVWQALQNRLLAALLAREGVKKELVARRLDAEDLLQSVFVKFWNASVRGQHYLDDFPTSSERMMGLLVKYCRNQFLNIARRDRVRGASSAGGVDALNHKMNHATGRRPMDNTPGTFGQEAAPDSALEEYSLDPLLGLFKGHPVREDVFILMVAGFSGTADEMAEALGVATTKVRTAITANRTVARAWLDKQIARDD